MKIIGQSKICPINSGGFPIRLGPKGATKFGRRTIFSKQQLTIFFFSLSKMNET